MVAWYQSLTKERLKIQKPRGFLCESLLAGLSGQKDRGYPTAHKEDRTWQSPK